MNYKNKYLKYKNKYLNIKKSFLYLGGAEQDIPLFTNADIILFKEFLTKSFGLLDTDYKQLDTIKLLESNIFYNTCINVPDKLSLSSDIHTNIQTFLNNVCVIDNIFSYLYNNNKELYILIAGPDTWEKRMKKITELLLQFVNSYCQTNASTCLYTEDNNTTLLEDIIYLYKLLINDIIEYNEHNNFYTIAGDSIKPNQTLKNIFSILINTLETIRGRTCIETDIPLNFDPPPLNDDEIAKIRNEMSSMRDATSTVISYITSIKKLRGIIYKKIDFLRYIINTFFRSSDSDDHKYIYNYIMQKIESLFCFTKS